MSEQEIKIICKFFVEYGKRRFSEIDKELLKKAIDESSNWDELMTVAVASMGMKNSI